MYCINCGVRLEDTEKICPLCNTPLPVVTQGEEQDASLYPKGKMPKDNAGSGGLNIAIIILFLLPLVLCFLGDFLIDGEIDWFGYVCGAFVITYIAIALPLWFKKPNPVIFVPCNFAASALYLLYVNIATNGSWFLSFAFPVIGGLCIIICTLVTLLYYLRRGRLYIIGGTFMALGAFMLLVEFLMSVTFEMQFIGWSLYPLVTFVMLGGLFIYFAINRAARELLRRKLFF